MSQRPHLVDWAATWSGAICWAAHFMKWVAQRRAARCRSDGIADLPIPADAELKPVVKRPCPDLLLLASLVLVDLNRDNPHRRVRLSFVAG